MGKPAPTWSTGKKTDINYRLNPKVRPVVRYMTGIEQLDKWIGGLPRGLIVIAGGAGSGKTMISKEIAVNVSALVKGEDPYALYFCSEVMGDAPFHPNVGRVDYTRYKTFYWNVLIELDLLLRELTPDLVVLDSMTELFSMTKKALPESDLRESIGKVHTRYDGAMPIIAISEVRGTGQYETAAGGKGVEHKCSMYIKMEHVFITFPSQVESFGLPVGDDIYTLRVVKDKHGIANTKLARVIVHGGKIYIRPALEREV